MQSAQIRMTTLIDYTSKVKNYIIKPLGDMHMGDVTADDIRLALLAASKKSASVYKSVNVIYKCIFAAAMESKIIDENPTIYLKKNVGGIPQKDRLPLTDEQVDKLLDGDPLSYTQFKRLWQYIVTRTTKERCYYRYEDGKRVKHTVKPVLGQKAAHNGNVVYSLDFEVTPHQLRHTYITNLIHASVDPKTVQYLAGHESSKITMDIYAKVKYNRPEQLAGVLEDAFASWD